MFCTFKLVYIIIILFKLISGAIILCRSSGSYLSLFQVVLKIIKHYQEEGQGSEVVQGVLLGLVVEDRLEITNCFPFPQHTEDDADFDEGEELEILCINHSL